MKARMRRWPPPRNSRAMVLWTLCLIVSLGLASTAPCTAQPPIDSDGDGIADTEDNCVDDSNPAQLDTDCDGFGNRCDADYDNTGSVGGYDYFFFRGMFGLQSTDPGYDPNADHDGDGSIGGYDFQIFRSFWGSAPGPSGVAPIRAFPGAEGFGAFTQGGRCGQVLKVTNLADSGPGSLRWALEDVDVPRTVLFDIGGIIDLSSSIEIDSRFVTVAGQTAPGGGITLRGARIHVAAGDVIVRGLRIRPGDGPGVPGDVRDGISVGKSNSTVARVIVDHCSFTWATDENAATYNTVRDVTYSNNLIAEGLENSIHPEGPHSMGLFLGPSSKGVSILKNLLAHNIARNPLIKDGSSIEVINNYVYNYRSDGVQVSAGSSPSTVHIIGNHYVAGVDTIIRPPVYLSSASCETYLEGNIGIGRPTNTGPEEAIAHGDGLSQVQPDPIFESSGVAVLDVDEVQATVTVGAGARWPLRDVVDERIVAESLSGTGSVIDSPAERGGYPVVAPGEPSTDPDGDGMPTWFETQFGFDPTIPDGNGDSDDDGYTNLEEYINGIISGFSLGGP